MPGVAARGDGMHRLDFEKPGTGRASSDFFFGGFPNGLYFQVQAQGNTCQRVVAVQYHVFGVEFRDREQDVLGRIRVAAGGQ
jgi:hypothetical protein